MSAVLRAIIQDYIIGDVKDIDEKVDIEMTLKKFRHYFGDDAYRRLVLRCLDIDYTPLPEEYYDFLQQELEIDDEEYLRRRTPQHLYHLLPLFLSVLERIKN